VDCAIHFHDDFRTQMMLSQDEVLHNPATLRSLNLPSFSQHAKLVSLFSAIWLLLSSCCSLISFSLGRCLNMQQAGR
jgi:hypothetical protein